MNFLPIVARELRVRARDKATWRIRAWAGGAAFLIGAPLLLLSRPGAGAGISGQEFFYVLTAIALLFCLFEGARQTSDSISGERREGTLGLLFLTDLKGYDVVLGKLAVSSLYSLFGLLAVFPVLSLGLLAGGIAPGEFWRMNLALVVALLFSLAIGTWVSGRTTDERRSVLLTAVMMGIVAGGLPLLDAILGFDAAKEPVLQLASPISGCFLATDSVYSTKPHHFWLSQVICLLCALGLLAHAALTITPSLAETPGRTRSRRGRPGRGTHGSVARDPAWWLAVRGNTVIPTAMVVLLLVQILIANFQIYRALSAPATAAGTVTTVFAETDMAIAMIDLLVWFLAAYLATDFLVQLLRTGFLELLLCTPLSSAELVRGHTRAMWTMLRWPAALWMGASVLTELSAWIQAYRAAMFEFVVELVVSHLLGLLAIVLTLVALTYAGAWFALTSRRTAHALGKLVFLVLVVPFVAGSILAPLLFIVLTSTPSSWLFQLPGPLVLLLTDVFFIVWAAKRLRSEFREAAVRRITGESRVKPAMSQEPANQYFSLLRDPR